MPEIAANDTYIISVDPSKNRLYLKVIGFWQDSSAAPNYIDDLRKACTPLSEGFTVVADLTEMKAPPPEVGLVHQEAQKLLLDTGLKKTAEVHSADAIAQMAVDRYSKTSGMEKMVFDNTGDAETWLDQS